LRDGVLPLTFTLRAENRAQSSRWRLASLSASS